MIYLASIACGLMWSGIFLGPVFFIAGFILLAGIFLNAIME